MNKGCGEISGKGDKYAYLGHFRGDKVIKDGHNTGSPAGKDRRPNFGGKKAGGGLQPASKLKPTGSKLAGGVARGKVPAKAVMKTPKMAGPKMSAPKAPAAKRPTVSKPAAPAAAKPAAPSIGSLTNLASRTMPAAGASNPNLAGGLSTPKLSRPTLASPSMNRLR